MAIDQSPANVRKQLERARRELDVQESRLAKAQKALDGLSFANRNFPGCSIDDLNEIVAEIKCERRRQRVVVVNAYRAAINAGVAD